ncbi:MAG: transcription-repair coupling factor [Candidatus Dadabacteria bacterium]|nr:transcription-repair coupling factor [Candidatus Dadabacteria bacterium]MYC39634.1 transcription-repair coupling factor [Candidatus Dadabacteria bacterium]
MNGKNPTIELSSHLGNPMVEEFLASPPGGPTDLSGLYGNSPYFLLALLSEVPGKRILHVCEQREQCAVAARSVSSLKGMEIPVLLSKGMEKNRSLFEKKEISEPERLHSLFMWKQTGVLCADAASLAEILPPPRSLEAESFTVEEGMEVDRDELAQRLLGIGYREVDFTEKRGDMSVRGSIVDLFSPGSLNPLRVELFADRINSLREFSSSTQKSIGKTKKAVINPASFAIYRQTSKDTLIKQILSGADKQGLTSSEVEPLVEAFENGSYFRGIEWFTPFFWNSRQCILDYPREDLIISLPQGFEEVELLLKLEEKFEARRKSLGKLEKSLPQFRKLYLEGKKLKEKLGKSRLVYTGAMEIGAEGKNSIRFSTEEISFSKPSLEVFMDKAEELMEDGYAVFIFFTSRGEREKFLKLTENRPDSAMVHVVGELFESTVLHDFRIALLTEKTLLQKTKSQGTPFGGSDIPSAFLTSFSQLKHGDYIVHKEFGIGIFRGLKRLSFENRQGDFLECEYKGGDKIFVPVEKSRLIQKYMGDGREPRIEKLGSANWKKTVGKVKRAVEEVATELVELCAERKVGKGFQFSPRDQMFNGFEMEFPWSETPDQSAAIEDVMSDMESEKAMDRLICGDVGFGKTEVALRAAFKACLDGKQVMVIAPTTLLASQHYRTALSRFEHYPVRIDMLSRFTTAKKEKEILKRLEDGSLDLIIGTHKLLGKKIKFRNLGLAVIDEEQKFGVNHKKSIRSMKNAVEVLTLSATPIPRTLQLSLADVRDISVINTPPEGRQPVEVYIQQFNTGVIKEAVEKEVKRNGTVFFIHNRIEDIFEKADLLQNLMPELSIGVTHGRMNETRLSRTIEQFADGRVNLLVTTAIVESGLDIPKANTIIVNNAHTMGLADLYQLKGRVGRSDKKAYAYFLIPSVHSLTEEARKRLEVLSRLTDLGSGFKLATADLQIRGAGTLFGEKQSGHIADIGLEFYLELLRDTVESKRGESRVHEIRPEIKTQDDAFIPEHYIQSGSERLFYYKKISSAGERGELREIAAEVEDRFGAMPDPLKRLILIAELRIALGEKFIKRAEIGKASATLSLAAAENRGREKKLKIPLPPERRYETLISAVEKVEKPAQARV